MPLLPSTLPVIEKLVAWRLGGHDQIVLCRKPCNLLLFHLLVIVVAMSRISGLDAAEKADGSSSGQESKPWEIIDSGRSLGSDNTESTVSTTSSESSNNIVDSDRAPSPSDGPVGEPFGCDSGGGGSGTGSVTARKTAGPRSRSNSTDNPWAPKMARNPSTISRTSTSRPGANNMISGGITTTTGLKMSQEPRLRRSRSNEDIQNFASYSHDGNAGRDQHSALSSSRDVNGRDDLKAMMEGVEQRRACRAATKAREGARHREQSAKMPRGTDAGSRSSEEEEIERPSGRARGRSSSRRDDLSEQKRSRSAPASNRSLLDLDAEFHNESSEEGCRKKIRWSDNHGHSLEEIRFLDPELSEGGSRRAEKLRRRGGPYDDDDEEAQYDSDESTDSSDGNDDDVNDNEHAEDSMVFDVEGGPAFGYNENINLTDVPADTSLSLVDAISGSLEEEGEKKRKVAQRKRGNTRLRRYGQKRDDVEQQEDSFNLSDLTREGGSVPVFTSTADEIESGGEASACFGEISMDLSEISAELNDELQQLPHPRRPSHWNEHNARIPAASLVGRSSMEDSMNVLPDHELIESNDKAIVDGDSIPIPTSVVVTTAEEEQKSTLAIKTFVKRNADRNTFNEKWMDSMAAVKDGEPLMTDDYLYGEHNQKRVVGPMGDISVIEVESKERGATHLPASPPVDNFRRVESRIGYGKVLSTENLPAKVPVRRNRTSPSSSTKSSPTSTKPVAANAHHGFDDFARWGNDSFEANTAPSYLAKKARKEHQHLMGKKPNSSLSVRPSRPERPPGKPRPPQGGQPRPSKGLTPTRQQQQQQQQQNRQQQPVRRSQDGQKRPNSTDSGAPRNALVAGEKTDTVTRKPSNNKGRSMFGGLFSRSSTSTRGQPKKRGEDEIAFMALADQSLSDSFTSFGDLAGLDSFYNPKGDGLAASITRSSQQIHQQRQRDSMKGRSLDDSDTLLFAHIKDPCGKRHNPNDSLEDLFDREMVRELRGIFKG